MTNGLNMTNPATAPSAGAPETQQAMPFSLPPDMTAVQAQGRLSELKTDSAWQQKFFNGDKRALSEFDELTRRAVGQQPPAPIAPRDEHAEALRALGAPADISGYDLNNIRDAEGGFLHMDEATRKLAATELFPAARGLDLSQSDVAMIASNVANPTSYEQCEAVLHKLWTGREFERGLADFGAALVNQPTARALIEQYESLSNSPMLISAVVAAFRRKQGRHL
jgi:hypothetical protein